MFRVPAIALFLLCFWFSGGYGQKLEISYQHTHLEDSSWETTVFMKALSADSMIIRAVNFSFLSDKSCAGFQEKEALFPTYWSPFLERVIAQDTISVKVGGKTYSHRRLYLIAEPMGMPGTHTFKIPGKDDQAFQVLRLVHTGTCVEDIYMEDEAENPFTQIGDEDIRPVAYKMIHPGEK